MAGVAKSRWSAEEDAQLMAVVSMCLVDGYSMKPDVLTPAAAVDWMEVEKLMNPYNRTSKQCRERWVSVLDPALNRSPWTLEEIESVYKIVEMNGRSWSRVAELLGTRRSELMIRNMFYSHQRRRARALAGGAQTNTSTATPMPDVVYRVPLNKTVVVNAQRSVKKGDTTYRPSRSFGSSPATSKRTKSRRGSRSASINAEGEPELDTHHSESSENNNDNTTMTAETTTRPRRSARRFYRAVSEDYDLDDILDGDDGEYTSDESFGTSDIAQPVKRRPPGRPRETHPILPGSLGSNSEGTSVVNVSGVGHNSGASGVQTNSSMYHHPTGSVVSQRGHFHGSSSTRNVAVAASGSTYPLGADIPASNHEKIQRVSAHHQTFDLPTGVPMHTQALSTTAPSPPPAPTAASTAIGNPHSDHPPPPGTKVPHRSSVFEGYAGTIPKPSPGGNTASPEHPHPVSQPKNAIIQGLRNTPRSDATPTAAAFDDDDGQKGLEFGKKIGSLPGFPSFFMNTPGPFPSTQYVHPSTRPHDPLPLHATGPLSSMERMAPHPSPWYDHRHNYAFQQYVHSVPIHTEGTGATPYANGPVRQYNAGARDNDAQSEVVEGSGTTKNNTASTNDAPRSTPRGGCDGVTSNADTPTFSDMQEMAVDGNGWDDERNAGDYASVGPITDASKENANVQNQRSHSGANTVVSAPNRVGKTESKPQDDSMSTPISIVTHSSSTTTRTTDSACTVSTRTAGANFYAQSAYISPGIPEYSMHSPSFPPASSAWAHPYPGYSMPPHYYSLPYHMHPPSYATTPLYSPSQPVKMRRASSTSSTPHSGSSSTWTKDSDMENTPTGASSATSTTATMAHSRDEPNRPRQDIPHSLAPSMERYPHPSSALTSPHIPMYSVPVLPSPASHLPPSNQRYSFEPYPSPYHPQHMVHPFYTVCPSPYSASVPPPAASPPADTSSYPSTNSNADPDADRDTDRDSHSTTAVNDVTTANVEDAKASKVEAAKASQSLQNKDVAMDNAATKAE